MQQRRSSPTTKGGETNVPQLPLNLPNTRTGFWLDAHYDPVASLKAFSCCLHSCDLYGDGDWRLAIAGLDKKLKVTSCYTFSLLYSVSKTGTQKVCASQVWKGTQLASEHELLDVPCAIASFYTDSQSPRIPSLAVAVGANVFIYRNLRPYFKFTLPPEVISDVERTLW